MYVKNKEEKSMRQTIAVLCAVLLACNLVRADRSLYATSSVLSKGRWVKIRVSDDGIYKLTHSDLKAMGFSDPSKVSIHGYGGWILDEDFSKPYIDDVPATAIYRGTDYNYGQRIGRSGNSFGSVYFGQVPSG